MLLRSQIGPLVCCLSVLMLGQGATLAQAQPEAAMTIENVYLTYVAAPNGTARHFADRRTGTDYCAKPGKQPLARVRKAGKEYAAAAASYADGRLTVQFGPAEVTAALRVSAEKRYLVLEVESVSGKDVEWLRFVDLALASKGAGEEAFVGCALALNLKTQVHQLPGPNRRLQATCYPRFGFVGAKVALIGCPHGQLRQIMQEVVTAAPDLPHSAIGGPWALDGPINNGSYLFNFGGMSEETVDDWIGLAQRLGITQIDFHGGNSFRFGDCRPNPKTYPRGRASFKAVIDKLHAAGIAAGLHTYAQFIDKTCAYVTPVPDPRLGKDAAFTLAAALPAKAEVVPVDESTEKVSATTGFFVRNSVTLQIDDELITYRTFAKEPPYGFTGCKRGAYGTHPSAHAKGAKVHHLRECFGRFVPDGESTLYSEIAANTADMFNECGFDMIYLDALDGSDAVAGREYSWHYAAKFTFEIWKRLKRPALMEMSTFGHHLWYVRSRLGAWDHPTRSHKKFIDIHCQANETCRRIFLPAHLGWWAFKQWHDPQGERTFPDDIEYLCGKCLGKDTGLSIMGIDPSNVSKIAALPKLAAIMKRYENLRHANYFTQSVKDRLRKLGEEFTLTQSPEGEWQFREVQYAKHKVEGLDRWSNVWQVNNKFGRQPLQLRIEALMSVMPYDSPDSVTLADFGDVKEFATSRAPRGIQARIETSSDQVKVGKVSGRFSASSKMTTRRRAWARVCKTFDPPSDLSRCQALGVWVHGDGKGEVLNLQLKNPTHIASVDSDHYIVVDFTGWRYFELVEPEGERHADYSWPYGNIYSIYRQSLRYSVVEALNLYYNNLPASDTVTCYLSPIRALPTVNAKLRNISVSVAGRTLVLPVEIPSGCYVEFRSLADCKLYGRNGELISNVTPKGDVPVIEPGVNEVRFDCACTPEVKPRAYVSAISHGAVVSGRNPDDKIKWDYLSREVDDPQTVAALDGVQNAWDVVCRAGVNQVGLEVEIIADRVEGTGEAYNAASAMSLETFDALDGFADKPDNKYAQYVVSGSRRGFPAAVGVTHRLELCRDVVKVGKSSARYSATSEKAGGWSARGKRFTPAVDVSSFTDMGFWLHGDGAGEILYLQLRDVKGANHDMKTRIDFTGWKYVQFGLAGAALDLSKVEYLIIYYNAIPPGKTVVCCIDDIRALRDPLVLASPVLTVAGRKLVFPVSLGKGDRLLYRQGKDCLVFPGAGGPPREVVPQGTAPTLRPGLNRLRIRLAGDPRQAFQMRVQVTKVYGGASRP